MKRFAERMRVGMRPVGAVSNKLSSNRMCIRIGSTVWQVALRDDATTTLPYDNTSPAQHCRANGHGLQEQLLHVTTLRTHRFTAQTDGLQREN